MPDDDSIASQQSLLATYRQTLVHLVQQAAMHGGEPFAPPATAHGIAEARANITRIKAELRALGIVAADAPNDVADPASFSPKGDVVPRTILTNGGAYAEGNIDNRQGTFVSGGEIYGNVIGQQTIVAPSLSAHDRDTRKRMLAQVRTFWVEGVLDQSLYRELLIALNMQTDPQAVSFTGPRWATRRDQEAQPLPDGTTIAQIYQQANKRLLILGAPGAGKTTQLLDLARHLLTQAENDETHPIPVVFNLSSWAQQRQPLERWLVQECVDQYGVGRRYAQQWLKVNAILPLLDGLDEVAESQRAACVAAINTFCKEYGSEGIVVCSRIADYQAIGSKLALSAAVQVQPLDDAQITRYLDWAGEPLAGVKAVLAQDAELRTLARSPLMMNILGLTYQGQRPEELIGLEVAMQHQTLFGSYIDRMFDRPARNDFKHYTREQTIRWLYWLACGMSRGNQTVFAMESVQPFYLVTPNQKRFYAIGAGFLGGILLTIFSSLAGGMFSGLILSLFGHFNDGLANGLQGGLLGGLSGGVGAGLILAINQMNTPKTDRQRWITLTSIIITLVDCIAVGLIMGFIVLQSIKSVPSALFAGFSTSFATGLLIIVLALQHQITPTEAITWSSAHVRRSLKYSVPIGILLGLALGVSINQWRGGIILGIVGGLFIGIGSGLQGNAVSVKRYPNEGTLRSLAHASIAWLLGGIVFGLIAVPSIALNGQFRQSLSLGSFFGSFVGILFGLYYGGMAVIQHYALRLVLALNNLLPFRCTPFLNYAVDRIFLRKVGGSYIFVHRLLLEHFQKIPE